MIPRSQQSFINTLVTTLPLSQPISKPFEHQRWFDSATATTSSCKRPLSGRFGVIGSSWGAFMH